MKRKKQFGPSAATQTSSSYLFIYTAIGQNYQSSAKGREKYPQSDYPIQWYIGLDHGREESLFAKTLLKIITSLGSKALADLDTSMVGQHINSFFHDFESFERVIKGVVAITGNKTVGVEQDSVEIKTMKAEKLASMLLEKAQNISQQSTTV